jgi:hypothetical protein
MMSDSVKATLTSARLQYGLGLLVLATAVWNGVSYFKDKDLKDHEQDMRLDRTDEDRAITKELSQKTGELTNAVVKLTAVIENGTSKRVEIEIPQKLYPQAGDLARSK